MKTNNFKRQVNYVGTCIFQKIYTNEQKEKNTQYANHLRNAGKTQVRYSLKTARMSIVIFVITKDASIIKV